jgi:cell division cycle 2-like protein
MVSALIQFRLDIIFIGVVYKAVEQATDEIVALKRLKLEREQNGFPITSLREINTLMKCRMHPNIVSLKEIVIDSILDHVYIVMEFIDNDLKSLLDSMKQRKKKFQMSEFFVYLIRS